MQKLNYSGPDRLIGGCKSCADFWLAAASLSEKQKGDVFERLVQLWPLYGKAISLHSLLQVFIRLLARFEAVINGKSLSPGDECPFVGEKCAMR